DSFSVGLQSSADITSIAIQNDGKILVVGDFNYIGGVPRNRIARLNSNGTVDESFDPGTGFSEKPGLIVVESDGKILVGTGISGASITSYNGTTRKGLVR